jgi:hypothetical protein
MLPKLQGADAGALRLAGMTFRRRFLFSLPKIGVTISHNMSRYATTFTVFFSAQKYSTLY